MLRSISLKNLATISDTSMEFKKGLNVITGETGSGKSILVDGLMLAVGARADKNLVRPGAGTASVEAVFQMPDGEETVIRREISAQGRSRVFMDDALSTLDEVRRSVQDFIALHSQRSTPVLLKSARQMDILDAYAYAMPLREKYQRLFQEFQADAARSDELRAFLGESEVSRELLIHEISLFDQVDPSLEDYNSLIDRRENIRKAMERSLLFQETIGALQGDEGVSAVLAGLLRRVSREIPDREELAELLSQASISVEEASSLILSEMSDLEEAPDRISAIDRRLDEYSVLISRCGGTARSMIDHRDLLSSRLQEYTVAREELKSIEKKLPALTKKVVETASELTAKRKSAGEKLSAQAVAEMKQLNMSYAQFLIRFTLPNAFTSVAGTHLDSKGAESVLFMFSANKGIPVDSLEAVASGGELSRVALALALAVADSSSASTLVFDEIDAGTGGETAHDLAESLLRAASSRQIIVVSHLAQIASRAQRHLAVTKAYADDMPVTTVAVLNSRSGRLKELARLLGGGNGAEDHASRLLGVEQ
ncbi:MAG: AAA family ATPase [Candidatus Sabulitectum sp.]|nr:AAA family ATPase [Candidatus Sabulitectum sp.]